MWLFTRYGFYSIACANKPDGSVDPLTVMVRARRRLHLNSLMERFPVIAGAGIVVLPHRDYRYRLVVPKAVWVTIMAGLAEEQDWSNFKNETARFQGATGADFVSALHRVWEVMHGLQRSEGSMQPSKRAAET